MILENDPYASDLYALLFAFGSLRLPPSPGTRMHVCTVHFVQ
jgi:hypothetical protein